MICECCHGTGKCVHCKEEGCDDCIEGVCICCEGTGSADDEEVEDGPVYLAIDARSDESHGTCSETER
jgi:hypothetical protein